MIYIKPLDRLCSAQMSTFMSALGQKQTYALQNVMSALPPIATAKADIRETSCLLPIADMCGALVDVR
jgi:hypothetical protein